MHTQIDLYIYIFIYICIFHAYHILWSIPENAQMHWWALCDSEHECLARAACHQKSVLAWAWPSWGIAGGRRYSFGRSIPVPFKCSNEGKDRQSAAASRLILKVKLRKCKSDTIPAVNAQCLILPRFEALRMHCQHCGLLVLARCFLDSCERAAIDCRFFLFWFQCFNVIGLDKPESFGSSLVLQ